LACAQTLQASDLPEVEVEKSFYEGRSEGWFFYKDPKEEPTDSQKDKAPSPVSQHPPMSTPWVREMIPKMLEVAIDTPTQENVAAFLWLQRLASDKALKFQRTATKAIYADHRLSGESVRPMMQNDFDSWDAKVIGTEKGLLREIGKSAALWFFYGDKCSTCAEVERKLAIFSREYGIEVLPIAVKSNRIIRNPDLLQTEQDAGQAEALGVSRFPSVFLASQKMEKPILIFDGVVSYSYLKGAVIYHAEESALIPPGSLDKSKILNISDISEMIENSKEKNPIDDPEIFSGMIEDLVRKNEKN
jgi:conjugal transfer pilus assembly protein TraF